MSDLKDTLEEGAILKEVYFEDEEAQGAFAISVVENPAIEEDFLFLSEQEEGDMQEVDAEKRLLMGAALVPNKAILRMDEEGKPYYIYFSKETIRKMSEKYLIDGNQANTTLGHAVKLNDLTIVESWIIEDETHDKSKKYNLELPVGTWMVSMKVLNDEIWNDFVKTKKVKGFSIEASLSSRVELQENDNDIAMLLNVIKEIGEAEGNKEWSEKAINNLNLI